MTNVIAVRAPPLPPPPSGGVGLGPRAMWQGAVTSNSVRFSWWSPADGVLPDGYNVYRSDSSQPLNGGTLVTPRTWPTAGDTTIPICAWRDTGLQPGISYVYYVRAVTGNVESAPGPALTVTTLSLSGVTPPDPPILPDSYIKPYALPPNNKFVCADGPAFTAALSAARSGDVIVLHAGTTYTSGTSGSAFTVGTLQSNIYIISDQDPAYDPGGTLPAYSVETTRRYTPYTANVASIPAGAQQLTMTENFVGRTGWYTTVFRSTNPSGIESRQALYQSGSPLVMWNIGLQATCSNAFVGGIGNQVTPWDAGIPIGAGNVANISPCMPTIQFTATNVTGLSIQGSDVRVVGINIQPAPSYTGTFIQSGVSTSRSASNVMLDRCVIGRDNTAATRSYFFRAVNSGSDYAVYHQCYFYGVDSGPGQGDCQAVIVGNGGPLCIQNCYLEAVSECFMSGGSLVGQSVLQHDMVIRACYSHKPTAWQQILDGNGQSISRRVKNHIELKSGVRFHWHDNILQNNASLQASQGQGGRGFVMTPRDQTSNVGTRKLTALSWANNKVTATIQFSYLLPMAIGDKFTTTISSAPYARYNGTFVCTKGPLDGQFQYDLLTDPGGSYSGLSVNYTSPDVAGGPWQNVTDGNIENNQVYGVGEGFNICTEIDYMPTLCTRRVRVVNNIFWINPAFTDELNNHTPIRGFAMQGRNADVLIDRNTFIIIARATGYAPTLSEGNNIPYGLESDQGASATGANTLQDRWQVTNNIIDGYQGGSIVNAGGSGSLNHVGQTGAGFIAGAYEPLTLTWDKNIFILDTASGANAWPVNTDNPIAYASVGFANFVNNTTMPASPSDWNVTAATKYLTWSTTGGPIGSSF